MNSSKRTKTPARVDRLDPATSALPIRVAQAGTTIEGRETVVVTQHYADRILVIVSQVGKIGALVSRARMGQGTGAHSAGLTWGTADPSVDAQAAHLSPHP